MTAEDPFRDRGDADRGGNDRGEGQAFDIMSILRPAGDEPDEFDLDELMAPPVHWPTMEPDAVERAMVGLWAWVAALQHRFPEMVRLPECWYRHNGLVELLAALRDHERASYAPTSPPTAGVSFHLAFRDIEARARVWVGELRCGGTLHHRDPALHAVTATPTTTPHDVAQWAEEARAARRGGIGPAASAPA